MIVLHRYTQESPSCAYLPNEQSKIEYELALQATPQEYEDRMNAGWRKFGGVLFHPTCPTCRACRPVRILVDRFQPDRSQSRAWKRNSDLRVETGPPIVDDARLDLYRRYHEAQESKKGWETEAVDAEDYTFRFLHSSVPAIEVSVWAGDELCAVALTEVTPNTVSGIYHYHDPSRMDRGLGTFAILHVIELARQVGKPYAYFGYYVAGCGSLSYKTRYRPCEILDADGEWREFGSRQSE